MRSHDHKGVSLGLHHYGVWNVGTDWTWKDHEARQASRHKPHLTIHWAGDHYSAVITIASNNSFNSRLVHWEYEDFPKDHPIIPELEKLKVGYHESPAGSPLNLDLLRGGVITTPGRMYRQTMAGPSNDLVEHIVDILHGAVERKATLYIFGEPYPGNKGMHQVHQNQGNYYFADEPDLKLRERTKKWYYENGVGQDGGLFLHFPDDDTWTAIFMAFASQTMQTDEKTGIPRAQDAHGNKVLNYKDTLAPIPGETSTPDFTTP